MHIHYELRMNGTAIMIQTVSWVEILAASKFIIYFSKISYNALREKAQNLITTYIVNISPDYFFGIRLRINCTWRQHQRLRWFNSAVGVSANRKKIFRLEIFDGQIVRLLNKSKYSISTNKIWKKKIKFKISKQYIRSSR